MSAFDAVVLAGGGNRCLWQAGFYQVAASALNLKPLMFAGSSAGATISCLLAAGKADHALAHFKRATAANRRNVYPMNALVGRPLFPHERMYRGAILDAIDESTLDAMRRGPDVRVQLTRLPGGIGQRMGVLLGLVAYTIEKAARNPVHQRAGDRFGFRGEVISIRSCETPKQLADLLLSSSCTPPFTPALRHSGRPVLDGGVVENVPVGAVDVGMRTLVLLTRPYTRLPQRPDRLYVEPSRPIPISKFDYTNPQGLQVAYDQGRRDADLFVADYLRSGRSLSRVRAAE